MQSAGKSLRQAREAKGLTLNHVNACTRIPLKSLEAIEADEASSISSPFLYKSFVRQFAEAVGLDYGTLLSAVQAKAESMPQPLVPGEGGAALPNVPRLRIGRPRKLRWMTSLTTLAAMLVACSAVYAMWQNYSSSLRFGLNLAHKSLSHKELSKPPVRLAETPGVRLAEPDRSPPPQIAAVDNGFTIELSAVERTWLSIVADGRRSFTGTLESSETKVLEGHESARIRTGNAGGVNVVFNGKELGPLGPRGQIRTVLFTRDRYEVLDEPAHVALTNFNPNDEMMELLRPAVLSPTF